MGWHEAFEASGRRVLSRADLMAYGATGSMLTRAVATSQLLRLRRDHYALPDIDRHIARAVRIGGRLGCLSALAEAGIFVLDARATHVHLPIEASRPRSARSRFVRLTKTNRDGAQLHWTNLIDRFDGDECTIGLRDALVQSLYCQSEWMSIATLDSALHQRLISRDDLADVFRALPRRFQSIRGLLDGRAESGPESVLRMIVRAAGLSYELQVEMDGIGRVDMVIEGCLVIEADSKLAHDGWERRLRDLTRDLELARRDYVTFRPVSQHILYSPQQVREAILGLLSVNRNFRP